MTNDFEYEQMELDFDELDRRDDENRQRRFEAALNYEEDRMADAYEKNVLGL